MFTSFQEQSNFSVINEFHPTFRLIFSFEQIKVKLLLNLIYFFSQLSNHRVLLFLKNTTSLTLCSRPFNCLTFCHHVHLIIYSVIMAPNQEQFYHGIQSTLFKRPALVTGLLFEFQRVVAYGRECRLYYCMIACTAK